MPDNDASARHGSRADGEAWVGGRLRSRLAPSGLGGVQRAAPLTVFRQNKRPFAGFQKEDAEGRGRKGRREEERETQLNQAAFESRRGGRTCRHGQKKRPWKSRNQNLVSPSDSTRRSLCCVTQAPGCVVSADASWSVLECFCAQGRFFCPNMVCRLGEKSASLPWVPGRGE